MESAKRNASEALNSSSTILLLARRCPTKKSSVKNCANAQRCKSLSVLQVYRSAPIRFYTDSACYSMLEITVKIIDMNGTRAPGDGKTAQVSQPRIR